VQYVVLFGLLATLMPVARLIQDFLRPYKHRSGLVDRRA
jgi:hypothetical protein